MYLFYTLAIIGYAIAVAPRLLYQAVRHGKYVGTLSERWGRLPAEVNPDHVPSIWIHAVSVGEVLATRTLIPAMRERYPGHRLLLSTTTQTGRAVASSIEGVDGLFYFPLDLRLVVSRVLSQVRPDLVVLVDTELWPNLLAECARRGVKTMLVNGRISDRAYPRYLLVRSFFGRVIRNVDSCCVQGEESGRRLVELGASEELVTVTGNLKFDTLPVPESLRNRVPQELLRFFRMTEERVVVMAASTHAGEERPVLEAFARVRRRDPEALLLLAPRHPERAGEVASLATGFGFKTVVRRELPLDGEPCPVVVVLDTVGELASLFQIATVVFLGGSLVPSGGHNPLEPAAWSKPIIFGPYMENFSEISKLFLSNQAARQIKSSTELEPVLTELLRDEVQRDALGSAAKALLEANRGATERSLDAMASLLPPVCLGSAGVTTLFEAR